MRDCKRMEHVGFVIGHVTHRMRACCIASLRDSSYRQRNKARVFGIYLCFECEVKQWLWFQSCLMRCINMMQLVELLQDWPKKRMLQEKVITCHVEMLHVDSLDNTLLFKFYSPGNKDISYHALNLDYEAYEIRSLRKVSLRPCCSRYLHSDFFVWFLCPLLIMIVHCTTFFGPRFTEWQDHWIIGCAVPKLEQHHVMVTSLSFPSMVEAYKVWNVWPEGNACKETTVTLPSDQTS